jgi:hypothetical protein
MTLVGAFDITDQNPLARGGIGNEPFLSARPFSSATR